MYWGGCEYCNRIRRRYRWVTGSLDKDRLDCAKKTIQRKQTNVSIYISIAIVGSVESITFSNPSKLCRRIIQYIYWKNQDTLDWLIPCSVFWINLGYHYSYYIRKVSNHIFTVWQHIVLLVLRQYEGKKLSHVCRMAYWGLLS